MRPPHRRILVTTLLSTVTAAGCATGPRLTSVVQRFDQGCEQSWSADCPPGATCNPPPPMPVLCPSELQNSGDVLQIHSDGTCTTTGNSVPAPCPKLLPVPEASPIAAHVTYQIQLSGPHCWGRVPDTCGSEIAQCNPPPPDRLACPPGLKNDEELRFLADGTCETHRRCPPSIDCPPAVPVPCPDKEELKRSAGPP